jgi:uncharacterized protein (TIGR03435 family)
MFSFRELGSINCPSILVVSFAGLFVGGIAATTLANAQELASDPAFDVASVKLLEERRPAPSRIEPGRIIYPFVTLSALIAQAYSVKGYQIEGPAWLGMNRYEVLANIPEGGTPGQVPAMLRRLLHDRFGLEVHKDSRSRSVYVLLVDTNGPKLKRTDASTSPKETAKGQASPSLWISSSGRLRLRGARLEKFAEALSGSLGEPVLDMTGIDGEYDIELNVDPSDLGGLRFATDIIGAPPPDQSMAPTIRAGLRALGLRLAAKRAEIQYIIVDRVEKVPTPN